MIEIDKQAIINMADSAFQNLEEALESQSFGDEKQVRYLSWKASSDVEYALFLFSIGLSDDNIKISWKFPSLKSSEIRSLIIETQKMLNDSIKDIKITDKET